MGVGSGCTWSCAQHIIVCSALWTQGLSCWGLCTACEASRCWGLARGPPLGTGGGGLGPCSCDPQASTLPLCCSISSMDLGSYLSFLRMGNEFLAFFFQTEDWPALVIALGGVGSESGASDVFHTHSL